MVINASRKILVVACGVMYRNGSVKKPVVLNVDNQACIALSKHSIHHSKTKHFAKKTHYLQDLCEKGKVVSNHLETGSMPVDILSTALRNTKQKKFRENLMNP